MAEMMRAVRKMRPEAGLDIVDIPRPSPGPDDVLVFVEAASLCGTDLHIWKWDEWSRRRIKPPLSLGHEFCGTVVEVGRKVSNVLVGDYVSAESHVTCGMCYQCRVGDHHVCADDLIIGISCDGASPMIGSSTPCSRVVAASRKPNIRQARKARSGRQLPKITAASAI